MSITCYTLKIKELCDSLGSININVEDDEMVQICLGGEAYLHVVEQGADSPKDEADKI